MRILVSLIDNSKFLGAADGVFLVGMLRTEVLGGWVFGGLEVERLEDADVDVDVEVEVDVEEKM